MLERACHCPDRLGGDTGIKRGRVQLGVAKQNLDNPDVDVLLEQVRAKLWRNVCGLTRFLW